MDDADMRLALREMRAIFGSVRLWAVLGGVGFVLGLSGPFETSTLMRLGPRMIYWLFVVATTFSVGIIIHEVLQPRLSARKIGFWTTLLTQGIATGIGISIVMLLINWVGLGASPWDARYALGMVFNVTLIAIVVSGILAFNAQSAPSPARERPLLSRLQSRLAQDKRGALISMSVEDHYVSVTTTKGTSMVLMRLGDAIAEAEAANGLQVHRSHWVATDHIADAQRAGDKATLTLTDGRKLPVSRTYIKAIKKAGFWGG